MSLGHNHHHHKLNKLSRLRLAIFLTAGGMLIEFIGGFLSNSLALISDAWHMLTHLFALGMSYFAIILALRPVSKTHTYGFFRAEVLAAFINAIVLVFVSGYLVYESVVKIVQPESIKVYEMFFVALFGLLINGVSILLLAKASANDLNIRSAILHELGDTFSSVAVVIGAISIIYTKNYIIDPILSLFICLLIVIWAVKLFVESSQILLEATPKHLDIDELAKVVKAEIPGIHDINHMHAWTITTSMYALTAHVVVDDCHVSKANEMLAKINLLLWKKFNIEHTNIQFECRSKQQ